MRDRQGFGAGGFRADWKGLSALLLLLPLLIGLGVWQLQRAEEKREMLSAFEEKRRQTPTPLEQVEDTSDYRPVLLRGHYDDTRYWLLDNRMHKGRFGYEVMALFHLDSGRQVLVNRGWVAGDRARRSLPDVDVPEGGVEVRGEIHQPRSGGFELAETGAKGEWPRRVQWLKIEGVREELGRQLYPFTVRLFAGETGAFVVDHPVVNVQPQRHLAYAAQWFGIALVALIFFLARYTNVFRRAQG